MKKLIASALLLSCSFNTMAETSLWKATKGESTVYLGGTIHILRPSDYPLPEAFDEAYANSDKVAFETDILALQSPALGQKMLKELSYQDERTVKSVLKPENYEALKNKLESLGMSLNMFPKAKPGLIMSLLTVAELAKKGVKQEGIDIFFAKKARKDSKEQLQLETPEEQIAFLARLGDGNEDVFYQKMLKDVDSINEQFIDMLRVWRSGDTKALDDMINQSMRKEYPAMYDSLLVERNNNWMPSVEAYFDTPETELVLVGAAHLIGEDGLIEQLKKKGYQIEQMK
ncbi:TraB/GumN family protein [Aliikangiella sp. G2MR2-5]|uniref:TraB/GumN family protein n=1 Tax=Aliikangiella sp. G2MR2-5 TaxID=2788943 RepID=UPI0018AA394E|nr:TraB/GumN family protein [Aliikangiella sp. G2MR2-5]